MVATTEDKKKYNSYNRSSSFYSSLCR